MTDKQLDELFSNPRFRYRMYEFIQENLVLHVRSDDPTGYVQVTVSLSGMTNSNGRTDTTILVQARG
jgi:hypothetical protein